MNGGAPSGGDERLPIALCLAGGGYAGALFELGAVAALAAGLPGWSPARSARVVGTSAGAVVGAMLAFGVDPARVPGTIADGRNHPLVFRRRDFSRVPWGRHLGNLLRGRLSPGFFTNAGSEDLIRRVARGAGREDRFDALLVPLAVVATDLDAGERVVFGLPPDDQVPVSVAVRASGAIPVYFEPVRIGERDFIDGQIVDPLHLDLAAAAGVRTVLAVSALTPYRRGDSGERVRAMGAPAVSDQSARVSGGVKLAAARERLARERPQVVVHLVAPRPEEAGPLLRPRFEAAFVLEAWRLGFAVAARMIAREHAALGASGIAVDLLALETESARVAPGGAGPARAQTSP